MTEANRAKRVLRWSLHLLRGWSRVPTYDEREADWSAVDWEAVEADVAVEMLRQAEREFDAIDTAYTHHIGRATNLLLLTIPLAGALIAAALTEKLSAELQAAAWGGAVALLVSITLMRSVAAPRPFWTAGCSPRTWINDVVEKKTSKQSIGEMIEIIDTQSSVNGVIARDAGKAVSNGVFVAAAAPFVAVFASLIPWAEWAQAAWTGVSAIWTPAEAGPVYPAFLAALFG